MMAKYFSLLTNQTKATMLAVSIHIFSTFSGCKSGADHSVMNINEDSTGLAQNYCTVNSPSFLAAMDEHSTQLKEIISKLSTVEKLCTSQGKVHKHVDYFVENKDYKHKTMTQACWEAIIQNRPDMADFDDYMWDMRIHRDNAGEQTLDWSSITGEFYRAGPGREPVVAQQIGKACPGIDVVHFGGSTGGVGRWFVRGDGFRVRHQRDYGPSRDARVYWDGWPANMGPDAAYIPMPGWREDLPIPDAGPTDDNMLEKVE